MSSPASRRHDQSYKLLFSIPLAIDQLTRHFLDAGVGARGQNPPGIRAAMHPAWTLRLAFR